MRFIDDMIKGIPLEEMTGGTDMKATEIKGIIPDEPVRAEKSESRTDSYEQNEHTHAPKAAEEKPITPAKPARVKSRWMSGLAAVLALVITAGGVMTYLGKVKNIGPLASVNSESQAENTVTDPDAQAANANANAKLIYTTLNGYCADMISEGRLKEIPKGTFTYDLTDLSDAEPAYAHLFTSLMANDTQITGGQISFRVNMMYKPVWAQWRSTDGAYVGQYPNPGEGLTFGESGVPSADDVPAGFISATRIGIDKELNGRQGYYSTSAIFIPADAAAKAAQAIAETAVEVTPDESKPELFGPLKGLSFTYDGADFELITSDRLDAGIMINGSYYNCPEAEALLKEYGVNFEKRTPGAWISTDPDSDAGAIGFGLGDQEDAVVKWYESFLAGGYQPTEDTGPEIRADATIYTELVFNGRIVTIVNTRYTGANVQVDGKYYSVPDTSVFDAVTAAYQKVEEEDQKFREDVLKDYEEARKNGLVQDYEE